MTAPFPRKRLRPRCRQDAQEIQAQVVGDRGDRYAGRRGRRGRREEAQREHGITVTTEKAVTKTIVQTVTATGKVQPEVEVKITPEVYGEIVVAAVPRGRNGEEGRCDREDKARLLPGRRSTSRRRPSPPRAPRPSTAWCSSRRPRPTSRNTRTSTTGSSSPISTTSPTRRPTTGRRPTASRRSPGRRGRGHAQAGQGLAVQDLDLFADGRNGQLPLLRGRRARPGSTEFAGTEIMRVADLSKMEVRVKVNENDIVNVKVGDPVKISIDAYPDRKFNGTVREIAPPPTTTARRAAAPSARLGHRLRRGHQLHRQDPGRRQGRAAAPGHERHGRHRDPDRQQRGRGADPERHRAGGGRPDGGRARAEEGEGGARALRQRPRRGVGEGSTRSATARSCSASSSSNGDKVKAPEGRDRHRRQHDDRGQVRRQGRATRSSPGPTPPSAACSRTAPRSGSRSRSPTWRRREVGPPRHEPPAPVESRPVRPVGPLVIAIEGVTKLYQMGEETIHALRGVSLEIRRNEYLAIMGPRGRASRR
jgi:hypothetical protein